MIKYIRRDMVNLWPELKIKLNYPFYVVTKEGSA
jgi:hypothetical protein